MPIDELVGEVLRLPPPSISHTVTRRLDEIFAGQFILETADYDFDPHKYAANGFCQIGLSDALRPDIEYFWQREEWGGMQTTIRTALLDIKWQDHQFNIFGMTWTAEGCTNQRYWVIAPERATAEGFFSAVCAWNSQVEDEIMVFEDGSWSKSADLFKAIKIATFESLVLHGTLKRDILADARDFFGAEETYGTYGVPWKRGILLIGPPGNGKTHTVKALINELGKPCLYVKSFDTQYSTASSSMKLVFDGAREAAPCVLVMEDLDALVTDETRSFFLNEVDGFASNHGILLLATTNHPERIDAAILNRPSRFDRKYHFELPGLTEREAYIARWNDSLKAATRLSEAGVAAAAEQSEGFSFAYLKELFISSLMAWLATPQPGAMDATVQAQIELLRDQMVSPSDDDDDE